MDSERRRQQKADYARSPKGKAAKARAQRKYRDSQKGREAQARADAVEMAKPKNVSWLDWWNEPEQMRAVWAGRKILPPKYRQLEDGRIVLKSRLPPPEA